MPEQSQTFLSKNQSLETQISDRLSEQADEEIYFAEETETIPPGTSWKILIVDDEVEVHDVTKLALSDFTFEGKSLSFLSAYSAQEAKQLIEAHPDIAIIFLDVVMEQENAGLCVIDYVRKELNNPLVRIILRTGQPGQAPENVVAVNYGIDDYKTKTELTARKLFITVVTALRAFSTLTQMLEMSRKLELEVAQHKQAEAALRQSEMQEREKVQRLERSLQTLQQSPVHLNQHEKIETLGQLIMEITREIGSAPNQMGGLYTMSMITRIARMLLRITDEHSARLGLSQSKLATLMYLNSTPDLCASPSALAKHCAVSRAAMTGLLDGLEQEGYVERDDHPSDRRALMVKLTQKGQQFLDWIAPQEQYQLSELMNTLDTAERQNLMELVTAVIKLLNEPTTPTIKQQQT
jgi:DNA-binding MarR family transcriptional regulator/DNA-binding response OmpR family regulator